MSLFDSDDSLFDIEEVAGKITHSAPSKFKPWHKPRKQYIRDKQWVEHLLRMIRKSQYNNIDTINYFGLPGGDLLDINYIHSGLNRTSKYKGKKLGFHGLINSRDDYNRAQGELTKLLDMDDISELSRLDNFDFEDLNKINSEAWSRIKKFGTYHFINLDFCNNILTEGTLPSLYYILDYQMKRVIGLPWLLCITTRLNKDSANKDIIDKFQKVIVEVVEGGDLSKKIEECFAEAYENMRNVSVLNNSENKELLNQILQICLVLWVLKSAVVSNNKVELKSSFKYSVDLFNRESDMHSFVFSFEKDEIILPDYLGIAVGSSKKAAEPKFDEIASNAIEKLSHTLDVDAYLDERPDELEKYANEMMSMLGKCGYDVSGYKRFMNEEYGYKCNVA